MSDFSEILKTFLGNGLMNPFINRYKSEDDFAAWFQAWEYELDGTWNL